MPPRRPATPLLQLSRSPTIGRMAVVNHFKRAVDDLRPTTNYPHTKAFLSKNFWPWVRDYLHRCLTRKCSFPYYDSAKKNGIYNVNPRAGRSVQVAIAGDWASGTEDSAKVAECMVNPMPDLTIHLGDVYYV